MKKEHFNYLVTHYNSLNQEETAELRLEQDRYGYCQVLHQLIARGDQDNQTEMKDHSLHLAAVYSTDRSVLKLIMTEPRAERVEKEITIIEDVKGTVADPHIEVKVEEVKQREETKEESPAIKPEVESALIPDFDADEAVSRFMAELTPMREKKLAFEKAMEEFEKNIHEAPTPIEQPKQKKTKTAKTKTSKVKVAKAKKTDGSTSEKLLQEIKTTNKKVSPETLKQKEQIEIIDQFIKSKPTISKPTTPQVELDLTEFNETYNENVVSETLALILIKQGKKEKAIEVLRKLIWKFPQKKAYFAAQIEDLTK